MNKKITALLIIFRERLEDLKKQKDGDHCNTTLNYTAGRIAELESCIKSLEAFTI